MFRGTVILVNEKEIAGPHNVKKNIADIQGECLARGKLEAPNEEC